MSFILHRFENYVIIEEHPPLNKSFLACKMSKIDKTAWDGCSGKLSKICENLKKVIVFKSLSENSSSVSLSLWIFFRNV